MEPLPPRGLVKIVDCFESCKLTMDSVGIITSSPCKEVGRKDYRAKDIYIVVIITKTSTTRVAIPVQLACVRHGEPVDVFAIANNTCGGFGECHVCICARHLIVWKWEMGKSQLGWLGGTWSLPKPAGIQ